MTKQKNKTGSSTKPHPEEEHLLAQLAEDPQLGDLQLDEEAGLQVRLLEKEMGALKLRHELDKTDLLCMNCHMEIEYGSLGSADNPSGS